jgi:hypothetical protein
VIAACQIDLIGEPHQIDLIGEPQPVSAERPIAAPSGSGAAAESLHVMLRRRVGRANASVSRRVDLTRLALSAELVWRSQAVRLHQAGGWVVLPRPPRRARRGNSASALPLPG